MFICISMSLTIGLNNGGDCGQFKVKQSRTFLVAHTAESVLNIISLKWTTEDLKIV